MTTIALVLGGPSAKDLDIARVADAADVVVGVNWAFLKGDLVAYNVVCDYRCMDRIVSDHVLADKTVAVDRFVSWLELGGKNFFVDHCQQRPRYAGTTTVPSTFPDWPVKPAVAVDGLYCRSNVGLSGLNFACLLLPQNRGQVDVYGLDLNTDTASGKTENWHAEHDPRWKIDAAVTYPEMVREWESARKKIPVGIRIRNMNPKSAVKCFEFA